MDLSSLDIFRAVAEEASITRAATRLQRVQSNVTTRIRQLEDDLGTPLFLRDGKRMTLTDRGQVFLVYADKLLALADEARQAMHPGQPSGTLRLGSMESTAASRLPQPLADFHRRYPDVTLEVSTGNTQTLIDDVLARRLDCALVALPEQVVEEGLSALPVFEEELLLILPEAHPGIATFEEIQPRVLAGFARGCTYRAIAEDVMHASGGPLRVNEVGSYHAIIACVAAGACVGLVPRSVLPPQARVQAVPVMTLATQLVWRDGFSTAAFECLREQLITAGS